MEESRISLISKDGLCETLLAILKMNQTGLELIVKYLIPVINGLALIKDETSSTADSVTVVKLMNYGYGEILVELLRDNKSNDSVVLIVLSTVSALALIEEPRIKLANIEGCCELLVEILSLHRKSDAVLPQILWAICRMGCHSISRTKLQQANVCEIVLDILHHYQNNIEIAALICLTLSNLTSSNVAKVQIVNVGFGELLVSLLKHHSEYTPKSLHYVCWSIRNMTFINEGKIRLYKFGVFEVLLEVLHVYRSQIDIMSTVCFTLSNLSRQEEVRYQMGEIDGLELLLDIVVEYENIDIARSITRCIHRLVSNQSGNTKTKIKLMSNPIKCCEVLIALLSIYQSIDTKIIETICEIISALTVIDDVKTLIGQDLDGCELFVELLKTYLQHVDTVKHVIYVIYRLAVNDENETKLGELGCCELLVDALRTHKDNAILVRNACGAIGNMANQSVHKQKLYNAGSAELVSDVLQNYKDNADIVFVALLAIGRIITDDDIGNKLTTSNICEIVKDVLQLHRNNSQVVYSGLLAIGNLAVNVNNRQKLKVMGCVELVSNILSQHKDIMEITEVGNGTIRNLQATEENGNGCIIC